MLKFISLNYPSNLMEFFIENANTHIKYFYKHKLDLEPEDSYQLPPLYDIYNISPYFLDNAGDLLAQNLFFWGLGLFLISLDLIPYKNYKSKIFVKIMRALNLFLKNAIVWEFTIFMFFVNFPEVFLRILISFKFRTNSSVKGTLNLLLAILLFMVSVYIICYLLYLIFLYLVFY